MKPESKVKRSHKEMVEVYDEELKLGESKQSYFKEVKRLRKDNADLNNKLLNAKFNEQMSGKRLLGSKPDEFMNTNEGSDF